MKRPFEVMILLAIAAVSSATSFGLDPATAGLLLAALNVALASCAGLR
jgi:hypothetical protein